MISDLLSRLLPQLRPTNTPLQVAPPLEQQTETTSSTPAAPTTPDTIPELARDRQAIVDYPFAVFNIELTNRCPFKCVMCPRTNSMTRAQGLMEFDLFQKIIDEFIAANPHFARTSEIWLHGFGESLVHPEFARFMRYATDRGVFAGLSINPLMLTPETAAELLEANPAHLYISLDGHDNESFEKIRGVKNAYDRSKERLLAFLERKVAGGYRTRVTLSMIDFSLNQASIEKMAAYWESVPGIDHVLIKPFTTWDGTAAEVNAFVGRQPDSSAASSHLPVICQMPWVKMTVKWDGDVVPCCYDYDKKYVLGNVSQQSLAEIWNGERMQALRREMINDQVTNPLCKNCEHLREV